MIKNLWIKIKDFFTSKSVNTSILQILAYIVVGVGAGLINIWYCIFFYLGALMATVFKYINEQD